MASDRSNSPFAQIFGNMASVINLHYETELAARTPALTAAFLVDRALAARALDPSEENVWPAGSAHRNARNSKESVNG